MAPAQAHLTRAGMSDVVEDVSILQLFNDGIGFPRRVSY